MDNYRPSIEDLFDKNPYDSFDGSCLDLKVDLQGWHSDNDIFRELIEQTDPRLIIEVGSWKGASAINMAKYLKKKNLDCKILCVDTWLGGVDHLGFKESNDPEEIGWYRSLAHKHGYPQLYYQFLHNVIEEKVQDVIIPFPNTSSIAAEWLRLKGTKATIIYIDASHIERDVFSDLNNYYELLNKGGVIFGDDYEPKPWPGVVNAVNRFVKDNKLNLELKENGYFWAIKKIESL